ncbi:MAG: alanine racemase [Sphingomonas sp.]|nr:alanine racemase [Sphingomonas sp.]
MDAPLRLRLDGDALVANYHVLARMSGAAACGAAVKANGYGLGATAVVERLAAAGCRDFFVASWAEAAVLAPLGVAVSVLHGVRDTDMALALNLPMVRPVLNSATQVARWRASGGGRCDVMVDTGMNRLGVSVAEVRAGLLDGVAVDTVMSHLACADEDSVVNVRQRAALIAVAPRVAATRLSLANSAGIALGADYAFDLTRPGLALYGGVPRGELAGRVAQVATPEAQILQRRVLRAGDSIGYNATFTAPGDMEVAILNIGYADGYWRGFTGRGAALAGGRRLPVLGRVSMDLTAIDVTRAPDLAEGDWLALDFDLTQAAAQSGLSPYELLVALGDRFDRYWVG